MIPTILYSEKLNYGNGKKINDFQGLAWGRDEQAEYREFLGTENTLYDTIMLDLYHYTSIQTHRMYTKSLVLR